MENKASGYSQGTAKRLPTLAILEEIDHTMVHLARNFENLLKHTDVFLSKSFEKLSAKDIGAALKVLLQKPRILLAQVIVRQYTKHRLPLIDDIIKSKNLSNFQVPNSAEMSLNRKRTRQVEHLWEPESDTTDPTVQDQMPAHQSDTWPPCLPEIRNSNLLTQVFTHPSAVKDVNLLTKAELLSRHNERLEFQGDSVLDRIICDELYNRYPDADEGVLTRRKSQLVCNETIWEFAKVYELDKRLQIVAVPTDNTQGKRSKIISDLFEAYIGGVYLDQGYDSCRRWLLELYEPLLQDMDSATSTEVDKEAKAELYRKIGSASQLPTYKSNTTGMNLNEYTVRCMIGDDVIGVGVDSNTKKAGLRAAMDALRNTEKIEFYANKRKQLTRSAPVTGAMAGAI